MQENVHSEQKNSKHNKTRPLKRGTNMYRVKINGKEEVLHFGIKPPLYSEIKFPLFPWGAFDVIGKKDDKSEIEILYKNAIVVFVKEGENEPYIADCKEKSNYKKICSFGNLQELKSSKK